MRTWLWSVPGVTLALSLCATAMANEPPATGAPANPTAATQAPVTAPPPAEAAPIAPAAPASPDTAVVPPPAATSPSAAAPASPPPAEPAKPEATTATSPTPSSTPADSAAAPAAPSAPQEPGLGADVRQLLAKLATKLSDADKQDTVALAAFYESRRDEPLWVDKTSPTAKAAALVAEIKKAGDWGLDATEFELPDNVTASAQLSREKLADVEMALSLAALKYARHARGGRITDPSKQLSSYLDRLPQLRDPKTVLEEIAAASEPDAYLRGLHPKHPQFEKLRQKYLERLKSAAAAPEVVKVPAGPQLVPGKKHASVALLRKRLGVALPQGTAEAPADETLYDDALAKAVKEFQKERGLSPDGIVGAGTRAVLNDVDTPSPARLLANMEEWRWMPDDLGKYHVWVNVPEFLIRVVKDDKVIHEERVITGLPDKQTPIFSDEVELVTVHPRWNVPDSIKVRELYPSLARGGSYFEKQNLRLSYNGRPVDPYSVDWSSADIRRYDVHQPPGASNVLGNLKFSFPNKHTVYMHDTATKGLFEETTRAFSHGCVRVRNPDRLAEILLGGDKGWDAAKVDALIAAPADENPITLDTKVPVHITYFTAWIDDAGNEQGWKDVYGHEQRIKLALEGKFDQIVRGPDHLAPVSSSELRAIQAKNTSFDTFLSNFFGGF
jgi:murein L,D-transpeptidase YcbB/YkuD